MNITIQQRTEEEMIQWIKYNLATDSWFDNKEPRISFRNWKIKENIKLINIIITNNEGEQHATR